MRNIVGESGTRHRECNDASKHEEYAKDFLWASGGGKVAVPYRRDSRHGEVDGGQVQVRFRNVVLVVSDPRVLRIIQAYNDPDAGDNMGAHAKKADEVEDPSTLVFDAQIFLQPASEIKVRVFPQAQKPSQPEQLQHFVDAAEPRESYQVSRFGILLDEPLKWENGN